MNEFTRGDEGKLDRRGFLRKAAAGAAAAGVALSQAGGAAAGPVGPNERINIGCIGVGGRGSGLCRQLLKRAKDPNHNIAVVGVCDVWDKRTQNMVDASEGTAKGFRDYRELLQMPDLDAVTCATPDHSHAKITIDAMKAGKDVYCEKPLTLYWHEAKEVARVSKETGCLVQCGAGSGSDGRWWTAGDVVRQGGIGPLIWTQGGAFRNNPGGDWNWAIQPADPNTDLDWDTWLGWRWDLAPNRPYDAARYSRFRKYWDYSGGLATDLLYHTYAHLCIGLDTPIPYRVMCSGGFPIHGPENDDRETPTIVHLLADYPDQSTIHLVGSQEQTDGLPDLIRGQKASLEAGGPGVVVRPQGPFRDELMDMAQELECYKDAKLITEKKGDKEELQRIEVPNRYNWGDHMDNWLKCIRTREQPTLNAQRAYIAQIPISLSVTAFRENRVVFFDPEKEEVVDTPPPGAIG
ncbi:MAG: Gfo/Idh/MocA family protein [Armatimonadota bacterium]